jgi:hypothetical protein
MSGLLIAIFVILICLPASSVHAESTGFSRIDGGTSDGVASSTANEDIDKLSTASIGNDLYVAWIDTSISPFIFHVQKYDGNTKTWSYIDGINGCKNRTSFDPPGFTYLYLYAYNNELYLAWNEECYVYVEKYNPVSGMWTVIDNGGITTDSGRNAGTPNLCAYNGKLYLAFYQLYGCFAQIRVERYDGNFSSSNTWTIVDKGSQTGLNYAFYHSAKEPHMAVYGNNLMVAWIENNSNNFMQIRAKIYDGSSWSSADGGAVETGINGDSTEYVDYGCSIVNYQGNIYLSWHQDDKMVIKKYNGTWSDVPDSTITYATEPDLYSDGTNLYIAYMDGINGYNGIKLKKFDGTSWTAIDGNHSTGIILGSSDYTYGGEVQVINGIPYVIYDGACSEANGIKIYAVRYMPCILTAASPLTEGHLDSQFFTVTLVNDTFKNSTLDKANFQIINAPAGLSIEKVSWVDDKTCTVDLAFSGDLSTYTNSGVGLKISAAELNYGVDVYNLDDLPITHA